MVLGEPRAFSNLCRQQVTSEGQAWRSFGLERAVGMCGC
jgi:hypothetical protein